jgi:hypothetical protein
MNLSKYQETDKPRYEANIHKASFTERRLFYLNRHCHCKEVVLHYESTAVLVRRNAHLHWRAAQVLGKDQKNALALAVYKGMQ